MIQPTKNLGNLGKNVSKRWKKGKKHTKHQHEMCFQPATHWDLTLI
jgi:uncharacterized protein YeaC (DUF1315 family)